MFFQMAFQGYSGPRAAAVADGCHAEMNCTCTFGDEKAERPGDVSADGRLASWAAPAVSRDRVIRRNALGGSRVHSSFC